MASNGSPKHDEADGIHKSDSNTSAGAQSSRSHDSVPVVGAHPFGSLQVHNGGNSRLTNSMVPSEGWTSGATEEDNEPPPLDDEGAQEALEVFHHDMGGGDVVLILDLPEVFTVGYDCVSFTAKHFGGLRDIPPGTHFLWVAHPSGMSTRSGVWIVSSGASQVHVLQWDKYNEVLGSSTGAEARIQADNIGSIHDKLVPFRDPSAVNAATQGEIQGPTPQENARVWKQLTDCISEKVLGRITGQRYGDWFIHTADRVKGAALIPAEVEMEKRIPNPFTLGHDLMFTFTQLAKTFSTRHRGAERTLEAIDASPYIVSLLDDPASTLTDDDIVGEVQFAYIVGTYLGNDDCLQQWWHMLLKLILRAYLLPSRRPPLAEALLRVTAAQLSHSLNFMDSSILEYNETQARDLRLALTVYKRRLEESPITTPASVAFARIEAVVTDPPLEWDLRGDNYMREGKVMMEDGEEVEVENMDLEAEDERGEWAPEIVELDESGREKGLISWKD